MDEVDVSLPGNYSECLQSENKLQNFLQKIFEALSSVKSIKTLHLPQVCVKDVEYSALRELLQAFSQFPSCEVGNIHLPVSFHPSIEAPLQPSSLAEVVQQLASVKKITFVSKNPLLSALAQTCPDNEIEVSITINATQETLPHENEISPKDLLDSLNTTVCGDGDNMGNRNPRDPQNASDGGGYTDENQV